ncbi:MAG: discoidin domain-containing protein [Nitrosopumilaceae archaeon]
MVIECDEKKCDILTEKCVSTTGPDFGLDENGNPRTQTGIGNVPCPPLIPDPKCQLFSFSNANNNDVNFINATSAETLAIAGADVNVYKLLGIHEQCKLVDVTGKGKAISSGEISAFPASNAFDIFLTEWHSIQLGPAVTLSAYIGYDFGFIKTSDDVRRMYGIDASVRKHITALAIKQSSNLLRRATKIRVERSDDGKKWYGVSIVLLPDDDCLNTILFRHSVPSRYWRLRPLEFNGSGSGEYWAVQALQLFHNFMATAVDNIQDKIFFENRDRDYSSEAELLKGYYDLVDTQSELTKFGIELPGQTFYITINFSQAVSVLGRPIIIGDVIELPSETQFTPTLRPIKKWLEVTDVSWSTEGYTPGWKPTLLRVITQPLLASQETQDIFGDLVPKQDATGLVDKEDGNSTQYQDFFDISQTISAIAKEDLPESGAEGSSHIREFEVEEIIKAKQQGVLHLNRIGLNSQGLYVEDAMPPNNSTFTEGDAFPVDPSDKVYHRLTYSTLSKFYPPRLYRFSVAKGRWIFLEKDRRQEFDPGKPKINEYLTSKERIRHDKIVKRNQDVEACP